MADQNEAFDASVGLAFSLKAFEMYRKSGMLSAEIRPVSGIRGKCMAYLELILGKIVTCYLIDKAGTRHSVSLPLLVQLDAEKGPFNWVFHATPAQTIAPFAPKLVNQPPAPTKLASPIPQLQKHSLDPQQLQQWKPQQQQYIHLIFSMINGQRSIDEIKGQTSLSTAVVDEVIRILLALKMIVLS